MTECKLASTSKLLLFAIAIAIPTPSAHAQSETTTTTLPAYDVVSIKPNTSSNTSWDIESNNDRFEATNVSIKELLQDAYGIKPDLISGVSGPINSARFDVIAKIVDPDLAAPKKLSNKQLQAMLLPVLEDRFQLKAHTEIKTLPVYELVVTQSGPKFKPSSGNHKHGGTSINNIHELTANDIPMTAFASSLTGQVHRTVIDKTGLAGNYDLALKWSLDDGSTAETDSAPSIFTALKEQLGLKLQSAKGPVETLVVDHVDMPSAN